MSSAPRFTVVSFESRRAEAAAKLIEQYGGRAISAPSLQEVPLERNEEVFRFAEKLFGGEVDILLCLTGVGTRMLLQTLETRYRIEEILEALSSLVTLCRGPKPLAVLREYGIPITISVPEPNTWREVLESLDGSEQTAPLQGKVVAVQEYGETNEDLIEGLSGRGMQVIRIRVYRWELPDDRKPLKEAIQAIINGEVQAVLFTSRKQVDHVLQVAAQEGLEEKFRSAVGRIVVASVGPVCSETLRSHGIPVDFEPEHAKLAPFVKQTLERIPKLLSE